MYVPIGKRHISKRFMVSDAQEVDSKTKNARHGHAVCSVLCAVLCVRLQACQRVEY